MMTRVVARGSRQEVVDRSGDRLMAMTLAVQLHQGHFRRGTEGNRAVRDTADEIFYFIVGLALCIEWGPVTDQTTGQLQDALPRSPGGHMQLKDSQQVAGHVKARDAKGYEIADNPLDTADDVTWSVDDTSIATVEASNGGRDFTLTAGAPGSCVLSGTIGDRVITEAVDVITGDLAALEVTFDDPTDQATP
jgi:hypothetical protein